MQAAISNVKQRILVLGAGELGLAVLQGLAGRSTASINITVLLRQATVQNSSMEKQQDIQAIRKDNPLLARPAIRNEVDSLACVPPRSTLKNESLVDDVQVFGLC